MIGFELRQAITGVETSTTKLTSVDDAGKRRESACQRLVDRAISLANASGVFISATFEDLELLDYLKITLSKCSPGNPLFRTTLLRMHLVRAQLLRDPSVSDEIKGFCCTHDIFAIPLEEQYGWTPARAGNALAQLQYFAERDWDATEMSKDTNALFDLVNDVLLLIIISVCSLREHGLKMQRQTLANGFARILHIVGSLFTLINAKLAQLGDQTLLKQGWGAMMESFSRLGTNVLSCLRDGVLELDGATGGVLLQDPSFLSMVKTIEIMVLKGLKLLVNAPPCADGIPIVHQKFDTICR